MNPVEMTQAINHALLETTMASTFALLLVLLTRRRLRGVFGATVAYAAWLLVPVASIAVLLPAAPADSAAIPVVYSLVAQPMQSVVTGAEPSIHVTTWLCSAWLLGVIAMLLYFIRQQHQFKASLGRLLVREMDVLQADAVAGLPAAIGLINPVVVLPADFDTRYSAEQRDLMLVHERTHIRHGDLYANAAFVALRCVFWFNPLLHLAARAFHHDQELVCDQRVIARYPTSRRAYGEAMFRTQLATQALPLGCHWGFTHPLKERIEMLKQPITSSLRLATGSALVVMMTLGFGLTAWAVQPVKQAADTGITIELENVPFRDAVEKVAAQAGLHLENPEVLSSNAKVSFKFDDQPVSLVMELLGEEARLTPKIMNGNIRFEQKTDDLTLKAAPVRSVTMAPPGYPKDEADQKIEGNVVLIVDVAADGTVSKVEVERGSKNSNLDREAAKAAATWKFTPEIKDGKAVAGRVRVPVDFRMHDPDAQKS